MRPWGDPAIVVLDYFDGETEGLLQCGICGRRYYFSLIDWDEHQDMRIFSIHAVDRAIFEAVAAELSATYGRRNARYWVPNNPSISEALRANAKARVEMLLENVKALPEAVVVTEHIERDILALDLVEGSSIRAVDWWVRLQARKDS
jgi:hypothetical protein